MSSVSAKNHFSSTRDWTHITLEWYTHICYRDSDFIVRRVNSRLQCGTNVSTYMYVPIPEKPTISAQISDVEILVQLCSTLFTLRNGEARIVVAYVKFAIAASGQRSVWNTGRKSNGWHV